MATTHIETINASFLGATRCALCSESPSDGLLARIRVVMDEQGVGRVGEIGQASASDAPLFQNATLIALPWPHP